MIMTTVFIHVSYSIIISSAVLVTFIYINLSFFYKIVL